MKSIYTLALILSCPFASIFSQNISNPSFTTLDLDITTDGRKINVGNPILRIQPIIRDGYTQDSNELIIEFKSTASIQTEPIVKQSEVYRKYPFNFNTYILEFYNNLTEETILIPINQINIEQFQAILVTGEPSSFIYYKINISTPIQILLESNVMEVNFWKVIY